MRVSEIRVNQICVNQGLGVYFFNHFIKNPQTTSALTFLTYIISAVGGVPQLKLLDLTTIIIY